MSETQTPPTSTCSDQLSENRPSNPQVSNGGQLFPGIPLSPNELVVAVANARGGRSDGEAPNEEMRSSDEQAEFKTFPTEGVTGLQRHCVESPQKETPVGRQSDQDQPQTSSSMARTSTTHTQAEADASACSASESQASESQTHFHSHCFGTSASPVSPAQEYDLLDFLAVVQRWRVDILPITWEPDLDIGSGGTAKISQGGSAKLSDSNQSSLSFAFKRVHRESLRPADKNEEYRALVSEVLVLGHPVIRQHPNIVKLEGVCWDTTDDEPWPVLVLKKTQHGDLKTFVCSEAGRQMRFSDRVKLCREIGSAILLMHSCHVIHGDIKPGNVLIFEDTGGMFTTKVADYGFSTLCVDYAEGEKVLLPGSYPWTAREVEANNVVTFEQAKLADIFSFGMLCLWLLFHETLPKTPGSLESSLERGGGPDLGLLWRLKSEGRLSEFAHTEIMKATNISSAQKNGLNSFFESSLKNDANSRSLDMDGLSLPFGHHQETLTLIEEFGKSAVSTSWPTFQIANTFRQFKASDSQTWEYVFKCFENKALDTHTNGTVRQDTAFQLAFCYDVGFGIPVDKEKSVYWLGQSNRQPKELEDVIEMVRADRNPLYRDLMVEAGYFDDVGGNSKGRNDILGTAKRTRKPKTTVDYKGFPSISVLGSEVGRIFSNFGTNASNIKFMEWDKAQSKEEIIAELNQRCREEFGWQGNNLQTMEIKFEWNPTETPGALEVERPFSPVIDDAPINQENLQDEEKLQVRSMETKLRVLGPDHPDTVMSTILLSDFYVHQKRLEDAEKLRVQIVETRMSNLGAAHPDTIRSMEVLVPFYIIHQQRFEEAEKMQVQIMDMRVSHLGVEHPDTLSSMAMLAEIYVHQERHEEAALLQTQLMGARINALGALHPDTLDSMDTLVHLYLSHLQRFQEAENLQVQVVEMKTNFLGVDHPDTLRSMDMLVQIYTQQQRLEEAGILQSQIIETRIATLGEQHPDTLQSMESLVVIYMVQGQRVEEAEKLQVRIVDTKIDLHGRENPDTLGGMERLAHIYLSRKRYQDAEQIYLQILEVRTRHGDADEDMLEIMEWLVRLYKCQQRWEEAELLEIRIIRERERALGPENPSTISSKRDLASTLVHRRQWKKAQELFLEVVEMRRKILGEENEETLASTDDLAMSYHALGRLDEVEMLQAHVSYVLEKRQETLGTEHSDTAKIMNDLATTYQRLGRWKKAEGLSNVGDIYRDDTFNTCETLEELEEAILHVQEEIQASPDDCSDRPIKLNKLSRMIKHRFEDFTRVLEDLEEAIMWGEQAVMATPQDHPTRPLLIKLLGDMIWSRFEQTGNAEDMDEAIRKVEDAAEAASDGNPDHAHILDDLADKLMKRFEQTREINDINSAVIWAEQAVVVLPDGHPDMALRLSNLGDKFWSRFEQTVNLEDLEEAIQNTEKAVTATATYDQELPSRLGELGSRLKQRFEQLGVIEDLEQAIIWAEQAVEATPKHQSCRAPRLIILSCMFGDKYELSGSMDDLNEAIRTGEIAEAVMCEDSFKARLLDKLADWFGERFERTGAMKDLNDCVQRAEQTANIAATDPELPMGPILSNLAVKYMMRYEHTGNPDDLERAVEKADRAVEVTPEESQFRAGIVSNRDMTHSLRWVAMSGNMEDALLPSFD